ncbi:hypothetical protein XH96_04775 [Bradyrhizobium sp. CCBAU 51765]|nr:hypothetical protein XH96_04775 [Bradyrhizobium sp. CCBAU 51765]
MTLSSMTKLIELGGKFFAVDHHTIRPPDKLRINIGRAIMDCFAKNVLIERAKILDRLGYHL